MQLNLLSRASLVQGFAAAMQATATATLDFAIGGALRALAEAQATVGLWIQAQLLAVLSMTRLATSRGPDVDSWVGDFGLVRQPAVAATGSVTLSAYVPSATGALILPGVQVKTADGTQTFTVVADAANPNWNTTAGASPGYWLPAGALSLAVPVQADAPGAQGNVGAGTITLIASGVPVVSTVTNPLAFANGVDAQSDASLKADFRAFLLSLAASTDAALAYAASRVQQALLVEVVSARPSPGFTTVYVDDGSGAPSAALLVAVYNACLPVAAAGITLYVQGPIQVPVVVSAVLRYPPGANAQAMQTAQGQVSAAIAAYVEALPFAAPLPYLNLAAAILAVPGVAGIASLYVNDATSDVPAGAGQRVVASSIAVA